MAWKAWGYSVAEPSEAFKVALRDMNEAMFQPPPSCASGAFGVLLRTLEMQRRVKERRDDESPS